MKWEFINKCWVLINEGKIVARVKEIIPGRYNLKECITDNSFVLAAGTEEKIIEEAEYILEKTWRNKVIDLQSNINKLIFMEGKKNDKNRTNKKA